MQNSRTFIKALVLASVLGAFGWAIARKPVFPDTRFRTDVVTLDVIVTDRSNHSVDEVNQDDLQILEDGKPQKLLHLAKEEKPAKYAIAIDTSGSFKKLLSPAADAATFIINRNRAEDETLIIRFVSSDKIETVQDFTSDKSKLTDSLKLLRIEGGQTAVIDAAYIAVKATANYKASDQSGRRAVVLISDGEDRNSFYKLDDLVKLLRENNVKVFVIGIVTQLDKEGGFIRLSPRQQAEALLNKLAQETGGRVFFVKSASEMQRAAEEIAHDLHVQFVIGYECPNVSARGFHKVQVKIARSGNENLTAIARSGYFHKTEKPAANSKEKTNP